ncbi:urea ABC transporter permease subunit UrtB [Nocardiopsis sp. RSe5-2]|uniref:Urea ABC transporter permease subunit UrtB n=1 Tax=Nocardiopsis endophytica TaxID=3018445 RepID=A0ABT4TYH2_9ACTN|nr:urea ABC transporter permease subunit UrtB [Nocardiopsis endophytica]MDA2809722.1 urea ABC transporter permease subunit UrtB [Nocardiopsis endophytica]
MDALLTQVPIAAAVGAVLLLAALGLNFTFGQMGVINMAHGEFLMVGAYTAFALQAWAGLGGAAVLVALPVAFAVTALMGLALERGLIRHFYGRPLDTLLLTFGVSLLLQQLARDVFGAPNVDVAAPSWLAGGTSVLGVWLHHSRLFIILLAAVAVAAIALSIARSRSGRYMRAVLHDRDLAAVSGIPVGRVDAATFAVGSGLAGVAGVALALIGPIGPSIGSSYIVDAFLVVVVGGLGQLRGAVIAAFALGALNAYSELWTGASLAKVVVFAVIIAFLQARPQGLFSVKTRALA